MKRFNFGRQFEIGYLLMTNFIKKLAELYRKFDFKKAFKAVVLFALASCLIFVIVFFIDSRYQNYKLRNSPRFKELLNSVGKEYYIYQDFREHASRFPNSFNSNIHKAYIPYKKYIITKAYIENVNGFYDKIRISGRYEEPAILKIFNVANPDPSKKPIQKEFKIPRGSGGFSTIFDFNTLWEIQPVKN